MRMFEALGINGCVTIMADKVSTNDESATFYKETEDKSLQFVGFVRDVYWVRVVAEERPSTYTEALSTYGALGIWPLQEQIPTLSDNNIRQYLREKQEKLTLALNYMMPGQWTVRYYLAHTDFHFRCTHSDGTSIATGVYNYVRSGDIDHIGEMALRVMTIYERLRHNPDSTDHIYWTSADLTKIFED